MDSHSASVVANMFNGFYEYKLNEYKPNKVIFYLRCADDILQSVS